MSPVKHTTDWEEIMDLLDGEIPADRVEFLKQHLRECEECRAKLDGFETVSGTIHKWGVPELPADRAERMLQNVQHQNLTKPAFNWESVRKLGWLRPLMAAGSLAIVAALALLFWNAPRFESSAPGVRANAVRRIDLSSYNSELSANKRSVRELVPLTPGFAPMIARSV